MRENRSSGSVEGAVGNHRPYSDRPPSARLPPGHRSTPVCECIHNSDWRRNYRMAEHRSASTTEQSQTKTEGAIKDMSHGIVGTAVDTSICAPRYAPGFAPKK